MLHVCNTLGHCFIVTHSINKEGDVQIYSRVLLCITRHYTQTHFVSCTLIHYALFVAGKWTQIEEQFVVWFRLPLLVMGTLMGQTSFVAAALGLTTSLGVEWSCFFQLPQSSSSPEGAQCLYLAPDEDNRIHSWVLLDPESGTPILSSTWMYIVSSNKCWLYNLNCRCNSFFSYSLPQYEVSDMVAVPSAGGGSMLDSM